MPFRIFTIHSVAKYQKIEGDPLETLKIVKKKKQKMRTVCAKNCKMGDPVRFFNIHSVAKDQKNEWGPFGEKIFKNCHDYATVLKTQMSSLQNCQL